MKKLFTVVVCTLLFATHNVSGQFFQQWYDKYVHTFAHNYSNEGRKVVVNDVANFVYTLSDVTSDLDPSGMVTGQTYSYVVLNQFDLTGNSLNSVAIEVGNHNCTGFDCKSSFGLQLDPAGNVYIGYMSFDATNNYDVNISKYSSNLVSLWSYKYNAVTTDVGNDLKVTSTGQAFALVTCTASGGTVRTRVIKATSSGVSTTALFSFNSNPDYLNSLAIDANQNLYITGYRLNNNVKNILIVSLTNTGVLRWIKTDDCGTVLGDDFGRHIIVGFDGFIYLTGSSTGTTQHGIDVVTMKFNPANGKKIWQNFINYNLNDGGFFVAAPANDLVYVSWIAGNAVFVDHIFGTTGLLGRRATYTPDPLATYGTLTGATISDMKVSDKYHIYLTGNISALNAGQPFLSSYLIKVNFTARGSSPIEYVLPVAGDFGKSYRSAGIALHNFNKEVYLLEDNFSDFTSHTNEEIVLTNYLAPGNFRLQSDAVATGTENDFTVRTFPNPCESTLTIESSETIQTVTIYDIYGKEILKSENNAFNEYIIDLDVSAFASGVYTIELQNKSGITKVARMVRK